MLAEVEAPRERIARQVYLPGKHLLTAIAGEPDEVHIGSSGILALRGAESARSSSSSWR